MPEPTPQEMQQATDIVVTGVREYSANPNPTLYPGGGGGYYFTDLNSSYFIAEDPGWLSGLKEAIANFARDDDGDGVSNFFDKMKGYDDNLPKIEGADGGLLAEISSGVYGYFNGDGDKFGPNYRITGAHFTSGSNEVSVGVQSNGGNFSYNGHDSMTYDLVPIQ